VVSVAQLDQRLKRLVEGATADARVLGEVAEYRLHSSGHAYFRLKDEAEDACIKCVMYKTAPARARKLLSDGVRVVVIGRATVYAPQGQLQFVVTDVRPAGRGALLEALERLKQKLHAEGLFAPERKRRLPSDPRVIGVVTSGDGAAIHDIVAVSFRRGSPKILLARATVQGSGAAQSMTRALEMLSRAPEVEVIILGRGGGSADDLSAFNDEMLVRKVASMRVPVVSAVGHEVDVTFTDLAADARAATPSQAAEMLVPDRLERRNALKHFVIRMRRALLGEISEGRAALARLEMGLGSPFDLVSERELRLDDLNGRMKRAMERAMSRRQMDLGKLERRLAQRHPRSVLSGARAALGPLEVRLHAAGRRRVERLRTNLGRRAAQLDALSPLGILARGYSITTNAEGCAVRAAEEVFVGDLVTVRVHRGALVAEVKQTLVDEGSRGGEGGHG